MPDRFTYCSIMGILITTLTFLKCFEHAIIVILFAIMIQLIILNENSRK